MSNKKTIMIIDDMKLNISMLAESLGELYSIIPATSGEMGIKIMDRIKPDLILLDVSMPGIDGFGVLKYIKENKDLANIPVIFVTGAHDIEAEEKGLMLGAVDYIKKPYNKTIIKVKVQNHLELKSYRDGLELLVQKRTRELEKSTEQLEEQSRQLAASHEAIIMGMSLMSDFHDKVTGAHLERIKKFTSILVNKMLEVYPCMLKPDLAKKIILYSPLHDIGKVAISDNILKKTGVLTDEEFAIMKSHSEEGATLLRKTECFLSNDKNDDGLKVAIEIAESHHEKYDGTGYPHRLSGENIPISARIVSVADVYDALRSLRPYKRAFTHQEATSIIIEGDNRTSSSHFDPKVLEMFKSVSDEFDIAYEQNKEL